MAILKNSHGIPAVPVASKVQDDDGKLTQEYAHFLRELADYRRDMDDIQVMVRQSGYAASAPASDTGGGTGTTTPPIIPSGDSALVVTNFKIDGATSSSGTMVWQPDGSLLAEAVLTWTAPSSPKFSGVYFYRTGITPPRQLAQVGANDVSYTLQILDWPKTTTAWTITAISVDVDGHLNEDPNATITLSPQVTWNIGPPGAGGSGQEHAPLVDVSGATITTDEQDSSDGVRMMRFVISGWTPPTTNANQFGGVKIAMQDNVGTTFWDVGKNTTFTTPWQTAVVGQTLKFYFLSYNPQNEVNTIVNTITPEVDVVYTPSAGHIIPDRTGLWWDASTFKWPSSGRFEFETTAAKQMYIGSKLVVGGANTTFGSQDNGQIAVLKADGTTLVGWIGTQQPSQGDGSATYGAWFGQLWVGGDGIPHAPLWVDNSGIVVVGGIQWVAPANVPPYISIRDQYGLTVGREVARIGAQVAVNGNGTLIVPTSDPAYIQGAWFKQLAIGGASLASWNFLADNSSPQRILVRNVNQFQIDYLANAGGGFSAAYRLLYGMDQWSAGVTMSSYRFPGLSLMRATTDGSGNITGVTTHGATMINRGFIVGSPSLTPIGSLYTFNGDASGGDAGTFWGQFMLASPYSNQINVFLRSGSTGSSGSSPSVDGSTGSAYMYLKDQLQNVTFEVRENGDVRFRRALLWGASATTLIDSTGTYVGPVAGTGTPGAWTAYTPSVSGSPYSATVNFVDCAYLQYGKVVYIRIGLTVLVPTVNTNETLTISLPPGITPKSNWQALTCALWKGTYSNTSLGVPPPAIAVINGGNVLLWAYDGMSDSSNYYNVVLSGSYEAV